MAKKSVPPHMMQDLTLVYEGSLKRVWNPQELDGLLWLEHTNEYTLYGWRSMPDLIANRARALTIIAAFLFEQLSDPSFWKQLPVNPALKSFRSDWLDARWGHLVYSHVLAEQGAPTHFRRLVGADGQPVSFKQAADATSPVYLEVARAAPMRPEPFKLVGQKVYHYAPAPESAAARLIPLTINYKLGLPPEDDDDRRQELDANYLASLGVSKIPEPGQWLERPILEFFTSFEDDNRRLSVQEALLISDLTAGQFEELVELSYAITLALFAIFAQRGVELWQGSLQFAIAPEGLMLVDCPELDEMTLFAHGTKLSLSCVKRFYDGSKWLEAVAEARKKAELQGRPDWQDMCSSKMKVNPDPLPENMKAVCDKLYGSVANGLVASDLFHGQPALGGLSRLLEENFPYG